VRDGFFKFDRCPNWLIEDQRRANYQCYSNRSCAFGRAMDQEILDIPKRYELDQSRPAAPEEPHPASAKQLVAGLFEREGTVLAPGTECRPF
jgi:hypothetical protein